MRESACECLTAVGKMQHHEYMTICLERALLFQDWHDLCWV